MIPAALIVAVFLAYLCWWSYPRLRRRVRRRLEHQDRRFRNRLMAVARPEEDDDPAKE